MTNEIQIWQELRRGQLETNDRLDAILFELRRLNTYWSTVSVPPTVRHRSEPTNASSFTSVQATDG
jgi:hypothetical protein